MVGLLCFLVSACTHYPVNQQLENIDSVIQTAERKTEDTRHESDELLLILAFSGGGTRAAALSFGVLEALNRVEIPINEKEDNTDQTQIVGRPAPQVVNNELDYKVDEDNKDEKQRPEPRHQIDSQENAGKQAIDKRPGAFRPALTAEVSEA